MPRAPRPALRRLLRHRRPLAAGLLALGVLLGLAAVRPAPAPTTDVVVALHDLPAGARLTSDDLRVLPWPSPQVPLGALTRPSQAVGHQSVGAVRAGEVLTDVRLVPADDLGADVTVDEVAVPVRLSDAAVGALLQTGARVDVIAADGQGSARVVAESARVLSVPAGSLSGDAFEGVLVVLAVPARTATALAAAAAVGPLSVSLLG